MSRYNIFQAIYLSFYSKDLYRDVADNWNGKAFLYLLFILALTWVFFCVQLQVILNQAYKKDSSKISTQIPIITIKDGKVTTPENRPYVIKDPNSTEIYAIVDTSGQYTDINSANTSILVTNTDIITQPKANEVRIDHIPSSVNMVVDPKIVSAYIEKYLKFAWIAFFLFFTLFSYFFRILQVIIYAVIGKVFAAITDTPLHYMQLLRISMVAVTPAIILATIFDMTNIVFHQQGLLYFIVAMAYLFYGVIANKNK